MLIVRSTFNSRAVQVVAGKKDISWKTSYPASYLDRKQPPECGPPCPGSQSRRMIVGQFRCSHVHPKVVFTGTKLTIDIREQCQDDIFNDYGISLHEDIFTVRKRLRLKKVAIKWSGIWRSEIVCKHEPIRSTRLQPIRNKMAAPYFLVPAGCSSCKIHQSNMFERFLSQRERGKVVGEYREFLARNPGLTL